MIALPVLIPHGFFPIVKSGDTVGVGQILAQETGEKEEIINIPQRFSIPLNKVHKVLKKKPGNSVKLGDVIAIKKRLFGFNKQSLISNITGTVIRYERDTGNLIIQTRIATIKENIISPVDGVVSLCDNEKIVVNTEENIFTAKKGIGKSSEGELFILEASFPQHPNESEKANVLYFLDGRATGRIVLGGNITKDILIKGAGLEAVGFIGTNISEDDLSYMLEKHVHIPILELEGAIIQKLAAWQGKRVYIEGDSKTVILLQA
jgi:hypothetical protein